MKLARLMRMVSAIFISKEKLFSIQALLFQKPQNRAFRFRGNTVLQKALPESQDCSERLERSEAF